MKIIRYVATAICVLGLTVGLAQSTQAATHAYKLFDSTQLDPAPRKTGNAAWSGVVSVEFPYDEKPIARAFLAGDPHATTSASVRDILDLSIEKQGVASNTDIDFSYDARGNDPTGCGDMRPLRTTDITNLFQLPATADDRTHWVVQGWLRIRCLADPYNFGPLYLVVQTADDPSLPSPTPPPLGEIASGFLDLPWDYRHFNFDFTRAALSPSAYFDHTYPLLSSLMAEPPSQSKTVTNFAGQSTDASGAGFSYSGHDGYDYARLARVEYGEPVLAAADGVARYRSDCSACGHMILIDHENGYETRYMHLQSADLIVRVPGDSMRVKAGAMIGRVGATGNVSPPGIRGAHVHFMVVKDTNHNRDFEDDIPGGVIDPFGWSGAQEDPWLLYQISQNGIVKTGATSEYLWKYPLGSSSNIITQQVGGMLEIGGFRVTFPANTTTEDLKVVMTPELASAFGRLRSIGNAVRIEAETLYGEVRSFFNRKFTVRMDFEIYPTTDFNPETLSIYSSSDGGVTWRKELTVIDWDKKTATTEVDHLTQFALMGELVAEDPTESHAYAEISVFYDPLQESFQFNATNGVIQKVQTTAQPVEAATDTVVHTVLVSAMSDEGVETSATFREVSSPTHTSISLQQIQYDQQIIEPPENELVANASLTGHIISKYIQQLHVREDWIYAHYDTDVNKTAVTTEPNTPASVVRDGAYSFQMVTSFGDVRYQF